MDIIKAKLDPTLDALLTKGPIYDFLKTTPVGKYDKEKQKLAIYGIVGGLFIIIFLRLFAELAATFVGFLYPAYESFKAINSDNKDDDKQWLTYWVVYGFFSVVEVFADVLLSWFPFYYYVKLLMMIWLMHPSTKGATIVFERFLAPLLSKYEKKIEEQINKTKQATLNAASDLKNTGSQIAGNIAAEAISSNLNKKSE